MKRASAPLFFAIGAAVTAALFADVLSGSRTFVGRDVQLVYVPLREFWVAHGPFAGWYPYDGLGQSFLGMLVSGALHPMQWLNVPLGPVRALEWTTLLCFPFAFTGTALLARRLTDTPWAAELAGGAYAFSGYLVSMTDNPLYLVSAATLPWVAVATHRFIEKPTTVRSLIAGAVTASVLLAGDAMGFGVALGAAALTGLVRRQTPRGLAVALVGLALSGPQLMPLLLTGPDTAQAHQATDAALTWSLHPLRLLEMAIGPVFAFETGDARLLNAALRMHEGAQNLWARSVFIGAPIVVLALLGLRRPTPSTGVDPSTPTPPENSRIPKPRQFALGAVLLLLLIALGQNTPIAAPLFALLHGLRYPEKLLPGALLLIALSAALGADRVKTASRPVVFCGFAGVVLVMFLATPPELHARVLAWSTVGVFALALSLRWPLAAVLPVFAAVHLTTTLEDPSVLHSASPFAKVIGDQARAEHWRVATHVSTFALPPSPSTAASFAAAAAIGFPARDGGARWPRDLEHVPAGRDGRRRGPARQRPTTATTS